MQAHPTTATAAAPSAWARAERGVVAAEHGVAAAIKAEEGLRHAVLRSPAVALVERELGRADQRLFGRNETMRYATGAALGLFVARLL